VRRAAVLLLVTGLILAGCDEGRRADPAPVPIAWQQAALSADDAIMLRDVTECGGDWFVTGALRDKAGGTRPAAWTSADARTWRPITFAPKTFYGGQNVVYSVACTSDRIAALGAKTGGAHALPRTSSWRQSPDRVLHEVTAPFELFGGPQAINVARLDAGPGGFLIAGNRMSGAAVWTSPDGAKFTIHERAPALASDASGETWAFDSVFSPIGWVVVGGVVPKGRVDRDVLGWLSADGRTWSQLPAAEEYEGYDELQRVTVLNGVPVAVGVWGPAFAAWRLDGGAWRQTGTFGAVRPGGVSSVRSAVAVGDRLIVITGDEKGYTGWVSDDRGGSWRTAAIPAVPAGPDHAVALTAGSDGRLVLVTDDGANGRVYVAETGS
jgi:hypothetical protein